MAGLTYKLKIDTSQAQSNIKTLAGELSSLQRTMVSSSKAMLSAALGSFASPTGVASSLLAPIGQAITANQSNILQSASSGIGQFFGNADLGARFGQQVSREGTKLSALTATQGRLTDIAYQYGKAGLSLSDNALGQLNSLIFAQEQFAAEQAVRANRISFNENVVGKGGDEFDTIRTWRVIINELTQHGLWRTAHRLGFDGAAQGR